MEAPLAQFPLLAVHQHDEHSGAMVGILEPSPTAPEVAPADGAIVMGIGEIGVQSARHVISH
jgi:hypothetical protein